MGHSGIWDTVGLDTMGLGHNRPGKQWGWDTVGLRPREVVLSLRQVGSLVYLLLYCRSYVDVQIIVCNKRLDIP